MYANARMKYLQKPGWQYTQFVGKDILSQNHAKGAGYISEEVYR